MSLYHCGRNAFQRAKLVNFPDIHPYPATILPLFGRRMLYSRFAKGLLLPSKRPSTARQKATFCKVKGGILETR